MTTRTDLHAAWVTSFDAHIAHLNSASWLDRHDDQAVAEWEAREAELGALAETAGEALDTFNERAAA